MKISRSTIDAPRIEMLPLIDIVFLLLVFFIYAMLSMAVHHGLPVDLPQSGSAALETEVAISVTIQAGAGNIRIFLDESPVTLEQLTGELRRKSTDTQSPEVQIFADKMIPYQELFRVLDAVQNSGLKKISLQAEQDTGQP